MAPEAKVIKDSISPGGERLTTIQVVLHRIVLAELNTHRVFSRNSASSRAIPVGKRLATQPETDREREMSLWHNPANPLVWASEKPGMQGGEPLTGAALRDAQQLWDRMQEFLLTEIGEYLASHPDPEDRLHKSWLNRPLEWFMWHTVVISSTDWDGFFRQRADPPDGVSLAQPEIVWPANMMRDAIEASTPTLLDYGKYHLPYTDEADEAEALERGIDIRHVSSARCARTSHLTQEGNKDLLEDANLFARLESADPEHSSPLEHVARPATADEIQRQDVLGNFQTYHQFRHEVFGR